MADEPTENDNKATVTRWADRVQKREAPQPRPTSPNRNPAAPRSWGQRVKNGQDGEDIVLVRALTHGGMAWWYVQVRPGRRTALVRAVAAGGVNLLDYGEVVCSGFGTEPSAQAKQRMLDEFGFSGGGD